MAKFVVEHASECHFGCWADPGKIPRRELDVIDENLYPGFLATAGVMVKPSNAISFDSSTPTRQSSNSHAAGLLGETTENHAFELYQIFVRYGGKQALCQSGTVDPWAIAHQDFSYPHRSCGGHKIGHRCRL